MLAEKVEQNCTNFWCHIDLPKNSFKKWPLDVAWKQALPLKGKIMLLNFPLITKGPSLVLVTYEKNRYSFNFVLKSKKTIFCSIENKNVK